MFRSIQSRVALHGFTTKTYAQKYENMPYTEQKSMSSIMTNLRCKTPH